MVCLLGGSYAGRLSELILARVTCAPAQSCYHKITSLASDAHRVPKECNIQGKPELFCHLFFPLSESHLGSERGL